jgi:predicted enzyme related to lactoylglutathione lyase
MHARPSRGGAWSEAGRRHHRWIALHTRERRGDTGCRIEAGGGVVQPRTEIPSMGAFAYFKDTEGNVVGSWETF